MNKETLHKEIEKIRKTLEKLSKEKENCQDSEIKDILQKQMNLNHEISKLEWKLFSNTEKQNYRKTILNISKKMESVKGSKPQTDKKNRLELIIDVYDLLDDILNFEDLPNRIKDAIVCLKQEIDENKYIG